MNARSMRGVFVVEFAIVGLMLFVLLFGVLEMGRLFFTVNALNEAARRGRPAGRRVRHTGCAYPPSGHLQRGG